MACCNGGSAGAESASEKSAPNPLDEITVTGEREGVSKGETPATVTILKEATIQKGRPSHPKDVLNQVPGVWVSNLSGEGHSTAIRHPLTTSAVYLYLEDGIPTRSTGFFNHNAMYEINLPQAGGMEIYKGPGSALYGSDAIGGAINVLTRTPPKETEFELTGELGLNGWRRVLASGGSAKENDAARLNLNSTHSDGWHDHSGYDRQAATLRWDHAIPTRNASVKVVSSYANIDQNHVGDVNQADYESNPRKNNVPMSYRKVEAFRLSAAYEEETARTLLSITPYYRHNVMEIIPSWSVSYDPSQYTVSNDSFGLLTKYRQDFEPMRARLIVGLDLDYSPGSHQEDALKLTKTGTVYSNPSLPTRVYDYDVTYHGVSPYVQGEFSPADKWRVTLGLRYDSMGYEYDNQLSDAALQGPAGAFPAGGWYGHTPDGDVSYEHLSPKLGATYAFSDDLNGFVSYANSFRTPSQNQVFRGPRESSAARAQAAALSQIELKPVIVDNFEVGLRGKSGDITYETSVYHMSKKDDIVSYTDPVTSQRTVVNAGETLHRGVEVALGLPLDKEWRLDSSLSFSKQTYEQWAVSGTADYSGKEIETAPRWLANNRLSYTPPILEGGRAQLEWVRLGDYWRDAANTSEYPGHDLFNLRLNRPIGDKLEIYSNVNNLLDKRYAETSGLSGGAPTYTVGMPRMVWVGIQAKW
ncbi:MAG: TonB-dependent receptor [Magnetococcales bacterium]|nr:TonB-dependent receptor [Magnetococcales bacterium]